MLRKLSILVFGLIVASLFFRCSDNFDKNDNGVMFGKKSQRQINYLKGEKAENVLKKFEMAASKSKKMKLFTKNGAAQRSNVGTIDYSEIMEVIDTIGNLNYTFRVLNHPEDDENTFHNLVLKEMGEEEFKILLIKYQHFDANYKFNENTTFKSINLTSSDPCDNEPIRIPVLGGTYDPDQPNPGSGGGGDDSSPQIDYSDCLAYLQVTCCRNTDGHFGNDKTCVCPEGEKGYTILINFCNPLNPSHTIVHSARTANLDPCGPDGDVGVLVPVNKDDCKKINNMMQPEFENMVDDIDLLKAHINGSSVERSISYKKTVDFDGTPTISKVHKIGTHNSVEIMTGGFFYGSIHVHPIGKDPMFTWKDIKSFAEQYDETVNSRKEDLFIMIVCPNDLVYCLRIEDPQTFVDKVNEFWDNPKLGSTEEKKKKKANNITKEVYKNDSNNERAFLKMFENYGLSLYKADQSVSNWSKLSLNQTSNSVVSQPCN